MMLKRVAFVLFLFIVWTKPSFAREFRELKSPFTGETFKASVISESKLTELFEYLSTRSSIPFHIKWDGCYARAYLMNSYAEIKQVELAKIVVEVTNQDEEVMEIASPDNQWLLRWYYHVAPIVFVRLETGKVVQRVIDPSLFEHPVSREVFLDKLTSSNSRVEVEDFILPKYVVEKEERISSINYIRLDRVMQLQLSQIVSAYDEAGPYHEKKPFYDTLRKQWYQGGWPVLAPSPINDERLEGY